METSPIDSEQLGLAEKDCSSKNVVRVLPMGITKPTDVFIPFHYQQIGDLSVDLDNLWFTQSTWIVDSFDQDRPQFMLPGGEIKRNKRTRKPETIAETAIRETWEELRVPHISVQREIIANRNYSFSDTEFIRNEITVPASVPPFITATNADPTDHIEHIALVNPKELQQLLEEEEFRNIPLLDSLTQNPPAGVMVSDSENSELKENTVFSAYEKELSTRKRIFERFIVNRIGNAEQAEMFVEGVVSIDSDSLQDCDEEYLIRYLNKQFVHFVQSYDDRQYDEVISDLQTATEEVYLEEAIPFLENSGPQAAYLLGQMLVDYSTITSHELSIIEQFSPELSSLYSSMAKAYGVSIDNPKWFRRAKDNIRRMRDFKAKPKQEENVDTGNFEQSEYEKRLTTFKKAFIEKGDIPNESLLASYGERIDNFFNYLQNIFAETIDRETASAIFPNRILTKTSSLEELLYVSLGMSPYGSEMDEEMSSVEGKAASWQALRKIIGISQMRKIEDVYGGIIGRNIYRLRQAFVGSVEPDQAVDTTSTPYDMQETRLRNPSYAFTKESLIPIDLTKVPIIYTLAEKPFESIVRKIIERGDISGDANAKQIDDVIRFAIIAKSEEIPEDAIAHDEVMDLDYQLLAGRETIKQMMTTVLSSLIETGSNVAIRKVKTSGAMMVDSGVPSQKMSVLDEIIKTVRDRSKEQSDNLTTENGTYNGSNSSLNEEMPWSWLKLVIEVDGVPCELQLYPSVIDYLLKIEDDSRYGQQRLQTTHGVNRYPPIDVICGSDIVRNTVIKNGNGKH